MMTSASPLAPRIGPQIGKNDYAWLGQDPIPAAPYYDPAYFARECEAVFKNSWINIGHVCEIPDPGSFIVRVIEAARASVLIVRGKDGKIHAHYNVCPHRGTELVAEEKGRRATFSCPYHKWTFGADGRLISAPDFERFYVAKEACSLPPVSADVCGGLIFINFKAEPAQTLRDFLGDIADRLDGFVVARAVDFSEYFYEIEANWKVNYDNFQENYHLRFIHPHTGASAIGPENPFGYPVNYEFFGPHRTQSLWKNPDMEPPPPVLAHAMQKAAAFAAPVNAGQPPQGKVDYKIFPNLFMIGQAAYFFTHSIMPLAVNKTRGIVRLYWTGEESCASERFAREFLTAMMRDIHAEDFGVISAGQKGLSSGVLKTINFQVHEVLCRHFFKQVNDRVDAACV
jgi:phenylpropionate dioxygenase-like ring-hydroxylating dioxygenase large terminal subunit